jgi:hypothetical protein
MLLVLASLYDHAAEALVERWREHGARLLTCRDLSNAGWRFDPEDARGAFVSAAGEVFHASEIRGVLTRLPSVTPHELPHIVATDREYVAAEMTAFLIAWLSSANFPVINRPTPVCLMGPNWREEQWTYAALRAGMRIRQTTRLLSLRTPQPAPPPVEFEEASEGNGRTEDVRLTLTVAGERCFGGTDETLKAQALRLAKLAGVEFLEVQFSGGRAAAFVGAYLAPAVSSPEVADALLARFLGVGETVGV